MTVTDAMRRFANDRCGVGFGSSDDLVEAAITRAFVDGDLGLFEVRLLQADREITPWPEGYGDG